MAPAARGKKPRPPAWQQGVSRRYRDDPNADLGPSRPASRRTFVLIRVGQALALACSYGVLIWQNLSPAGPGFLGFVFLLVAIFMDYAVRPRIWLQPRPSLSRLVVAIIALGVFFAWAAWVVVLQVRGVAPHDSARVWGVVAVVGYVVTIATVAAMQRARYFRWR